MSVRSGAPPARPGAVEWRAIGTFVQLVTWPPEAAGPARTVASEVIDAVDRAASRFRGDSDLVRANRAAGRWVRVDPLLVRAVAAAVAAAEETAGLVDPTLGLVLAGWGYDRDLDAVRSQPDLAEPRVAAPRAGAWRLVEWDLAGAVRVPAGTALDLGAIGKAFAADLVAERVTARTGAGVAVCLGGDVAVAGRPPKGCSGWPVEVREDPAGGASERVLLPAGGLATSTTLLRRWRRGSRALHHLMDPRTAEPAQAAWRTVSATGPTCVAANTATTAAIVVGVDAPGWLSARAVPARLVAADGAVRRVAGWPDPVDEEVR